MVNAVGKTISEVDRAYLAGFLDADGAIMALIEHHQEKRFKIRIRICVKISQAKDYHLQWFLETLKVGLIRPNRTTYDWLVRNQHDVALVLRFAQPYLRVKTKQAMLALKILETPIVTHQDLLLVAQLADSVAELNVRSKNRRKNYLTLVEDIISPND